MGSQSKWVMGMALAALFGAGFGCLNADTTPPAAPRFDLAAQAPVVSRLPQITLTGSAEYGAKLELTSDTAFGGQKAPADQTADPYTARFVYPDVGLAQGENTFTLTATDASGNTSPKATLVVTYTDEPQGLTVSVANPDLTAGTGSGAGSLNVTAQLAPGVEGMKLDGREVDFVLSGVSTATKSASTDTAGTANVVFTGLTQVGVGTVTATLKDAPDLSDSTTFVVSAGPASSLKLELKAADGSGSPSDSLDVTAGTDVIAEVTIADQSQNPVTVPVQLFTNAPGALVAGTRITDLRVPGTFTVVAAVTGAPTAGGVAVSGEATVNVEAGAPAKVAIDAPATVTAGEPFQVTTPVTDAYGNAVSLSGGVTVKLTSSDSTLTYDPTQNEATVTKAGAQTLTATVTGLDPPLVATTPVMVDPAAPKTLSLELTGTDADGSLPGLQVVADPENAVTVTTSLTDQYGNSIPAALVVTTDAPGLFDGSAIQGVTKAGSYTVRAGLANSSLAAEQSFQVLPAKATAIAFSLGDPQVEAGQKVPYSAQAIDPYGNQTADGLLLSIDNEDPGHGDYVVDTTAKTIKPLRAGQLTVRAAPTAPGSALSPVTAGLEVTPAAPNAITIASGSARTVPAGSTPPFTYQVTDGYGNTIADAAVTQAVLPTHGTVVTPPGPEVSGGVIYDLIRPGTYLLVAQVVGTDIVNDPSDPNATLTVTAGAATAVHLSLARATADVGTPVAFTVEVDDAYGNAAGGTPTVAVMQGGTAVDASVSGSSWTPSAAGTYELVATVTSGSNTLTDSATVVVSAPPDTTGPTLSFENPTGDPTIATWPPDPTACGGNGGGVLVVQASDPSSVGQVWLQASGAADPFSPAPVLAFPQASASFTEDLCVSGSGRLTRGEVLANFAAADLKGNLSRATGGWCVDPDASGNQSYQPANSNLNRCAILKAEGSIAKGDALAADAAGDLVLASEDAGGDAAIALFARSGSYGLGQAHPLTGFSSPAGVALTAGIAFTTVEADSSSTMAIVRTRGLDENGGGTDDRFVSVSSATDRFDGVVLGTDGALYATSGPQPGANGTYGHLSSTVWKLGQPLDFSREITDLANATVVADPTSQTLSRTRLTSLCVNPRDGTLYGTGYAPSGDGTKTFVRLVHIDPSTDAVTTVYTGDVDGQRIGGCAVTNAGVAVTLSSGSGGGMVTLINPADGTLATTPLLTGYSPEAALDKPTGLALVQGYLFALSTEAGASSLVRFAQAGGF